ncbi:MAG: molybdopterin-dependent oxidoreductase [Chloroflexota bacterium]
MALLTDKKTAQAVYYNGLDNKRSVFAAGAIAGMVFTGSMWLSLALGLVHRTLANLIADGIAGLVPASFTEGVIQAIGPLGKELVFYGVLLGQVWFGGLLGLLLVWLWPCLENPLTLFRNTFLLVAGFWLLFMIGVLPLLDAGFLGSTLGNDQFPILASSFVLFLLYGLAFGFLFLYLVPVAVGSDLTLKERKETPIEEQTSRRRFIAFVSTIFIAAVGVGIGTNLFKPADSLYRTSLGDLRPDGTLEGEVTPTEKFYQVSKNAFNPKVNGSGWKLEVKGLVKNPLTFDYARIKQLPNELRYHTLTCISNPVGGGYIGNAQWRGTPLKGILEEAEVKAGVQKVVFTCADGYTDSIALKVALDPRTLLVYEMNNQPLTDDHGYPVRMLIPDIYGMKNAKWVTSITLVDTEFEGFWQKQGWDNLAQIKTQSALTFPADGDQLKAGQVVTLKGIAFAGARGLKKVEVSSDNGETWREAIVKPALSDTSWALWRLEWNVPPGGNKTYILKVRATDGTGLLQDMQVNSPFPKGATGYHTVSISAS